MATLALAAALTFTPVMGERWIPAEYLDDIRKEAAHRNHTSGDVTAPPPTTWGEVGGGEHLVRQLVEQYFHPDDWDAAMRVADCESNFISTARNPRSSATGVWQFLKSTWAFVAPAIGAPGWPEGALDPRWSTRGAAWLWYRVGPTQWTCY